MALWYYGWEVRQNKQYQSVAQYHTHQLEFIPGLSKRNKKEEEEKEKEKNKLCKLNVRNKEKF